MAVNNSLTATKSKKAGLTAFLTQDAVKRQINSVVGGKNGTRFISSIVSAVQATPALQECTNQSILSAALLGEALNLSPSPQLGQFYMVPFNNKNRGCKEAQFQLGYKGYVQLAKRSGVYKKINVVSIKEGELISYSPLEEELEVNLIEDDIIREDAPTIGYYAMFEEINGYKHSMYWSKRKMLAHADKYSQAFHLNKVESSNPKYSRVSYEDFEKGNYPKGDEWKYSSFWYRDFDAMAHKTMLRQLISKWGTMSIDLQNAVDKDMAVIKEDGTPEYVENEQTIDNSVVSEQELNEVENEPVKESVTDNSQTADADSDGGQMSIEENFFN